MNKERVIYKICWLPENNKNFYVGLFAIVVSVIADNIPLALVACLNFAVAGSIEKIK